MNKKIFVYGLLAVILALAFTACSGSGGGKSLNSATELKEYLDKQPGNSPDQPIKVAMKVNDMMIGEIVGVIKSANKYVSLNLSGSPLTEIPNNAFRDCETLVGITIGNGVTSIGENAFSGTGLTSVIIPNSVTSLSGFGGTGLTSITIPNSVTSIGNNAFSGTGLTNVTIPNSVTSIGDDAFRNCNSLSSVTIGSGVTSRIRYRDFQYCESLTNITVDSGNPNYASEGGILYNKAKTEIVFVPKGISGNVTIPNGVTKINDVFSGTGLTSIIIPNSVTSIGVGAFHNCASLTSITIPSSVITIENGAFYGTSLASITIPNSVTRIEAFAFTETGLTSVTFQGTISSNNLGESDGRSTLRAFSGDLQEKYLAGGIGTYTRPNNESRTWTKQ